MCVREKRIGRVLLRLPAMSDRRIADLLGCQAKEVREVRADLVASGEVSQLRPEDVMEW